MVAMKRDCFLQVRLWMSKLVSRQMKQATSWKINLPLYETEYTSSHWRLTLYEFRDNFLTLSDTISHFQIYTHCSTDNSFCFLSSSIHIFPSLSCSEILSSYNKSYFSLQNFIEVQCFVQIRDFIDTKITV